MRRTFLLLPLLILSACAMTAEPPAKYVYFIEPIDGAILSSPVHLHFGVAGMDVRAAGGLIPGSGHHHLFINSPSIPLGVAIPHDAKHLDFDDGETEADVVLPKGKIRLTLQYGDGLHRSYGPGLSQTINVTVR